MGISFIHIADVHLGSPLCASSEDHQDIINHSIEESLAEVVNIAISEEVDFIVIAGDLFDGHITNASLASKFIKIMSPAALNRIHIYVLWGNHDAEGKHSLSFSDNEFFHYFPSSAPKTFTIDEKNITLHGQSFSTQAITDNLAVNYPLKKEGAFNIGVLHTSLDGRERHDTYAPCSLQDLKNKEYDYWALGHIHKREVVNMSRPTVIYSGNLQGRHTKETGDKGCYIVKIDDQHNVSHQFVPLSKINFLRETINIEGFKDANEVIREVRAIAPLNTKHTHLRLTFEGRTLLSPLLETQMLETIRFELLTKNIVLAKLKNNTTYPKSIEEIAEGENTIGKMISILHNDSVQDEVASIIEEELSYFKNISDYLPEDDSLYRQLKENPSAAIDTLILSQLQKDFK